MRGIKLSLVIAVVFAAHAATGTSAALALSWSIQTTPSPPGASNSLFGVSCPSPSYCVAVGGGDDGAIAEQWNGTSWALLHPLNHRKNDTGLSGVSCLSRRYCIAVGNYTVYSHPARSGNVSELWNGKKWTLLNTTNPPRSRFSELSAVSCVSGTCTAVGDYSGSSGRQSTLAERWNGRKWKILPTPRIPRGGHDGELLGVSCTSARACVAVGNYLMSHRGSSTTTAPPLAEWWNGKRWTIQRVPLPGSESLTLASVSCSSARSCMAVGRASLFETTFHLAEHWNGRSWSLQHNPAPSDGLDQGELAGVACPLSASCTAVGDYETKGGDTQALAELWNGSKWIVQATPTEGGGEDDVLSSVSCPAPNVCTAVGQYFSSVLAERYS